jgi:hypothetical protein
MLTGSGDVTAVDKRATVLAIGVWPRRQRGGDAICYAATLFSQQSTPATCSSLQLLAISWLLPTTRHCLLLLLL